MAYQRIQYHVAGTNTQVYHHQHRRHLSLQRHWHHVVSMRNLNVFAIEGVSAGYVNMPTPLSNNQVMNFYASAKDHKHDKD